jgi:hypothetical protein
MFRGVQATVTTSGLRGSGMKRDRLNDFLAVMSR